MHLSLFFFFFFLFQRVKIASCSHTSFFDGHHTAFILEGFVPFRFPSTLMHGISQ